MLNRIKRAWRVFFSAITPAEMAANELADTERHALEWESQRERADAEVRLLNARAQRLRVFLATLKKEPAA